jgi:arylsulfatase A-like enzyme
MDVHSPYAPPEEYAARLSRGHGTHPALAPGWRDQLLREDGPVGEEIEHVVDMYDASIAYVDSEICLMLRKLKARGLAENLMIIVMADHGEELFERGGFDHGQTLYEEQTRCPLILVWPGLLPRGLLSHRPVQNIDVLPTIVALLGMERPEELQGVSLLPSLYGDPPGRPAYSEMRGSSVRHGEWKLWEDDFGVPRLFNLASDPAETVNLAEVEPESLATLQVLLTKWRNSLTLPPGEPVAASVSRIDSAAAARLQALGYAE